MSGEMASKGKKRDILIALLLGLVVLLVAGSTLSYDCGWGDDFAAYMSEGIAIAQGKLEEQTEVNAFMHPLQLPDGTLAERRVYVWGYPLMLALVYKLVGFDTVNFQSLIYYKLPILLCLAEMDLIFDTEMEYDEAMKKANKDVELFVNKGATHSFYLNKIAVDMDPNTGAQTEALIARIKEFIEQH